MDDRHGNGGAGGRGTTATSWPCTGGALSFEEAQPFLVAEDVERRIERFAVAGGMPMHLAELGGARTLRTAVCSSVLDWSKRARR